MRMKCKGCGKKPTEIQEYIDEAKMNNMTVSQYILEEEGTYNPRTHLFYCTECYIKAGMPLGTA
jgi:hypothetical protein